MKKSELKQVLRPLIKECIREVIFEEGMLSGIVSEVVTGINGANAPRLVEGQSQTQAPYPSQQLISEEAQVRAASERKEKLNQTRKNMLDAIGKNSYNGVNLFEGTEPIARAGQTGQTEPASGPLAGIDPKDAGVDISAFFGAQTRKCN
tara:strand:+ start:410 stop:856 length:447 start_codon:yes stop_codon:yes gene_type:complete